MTDQEALIDSLKKKNVLKNPRVEEAFYRVDRKDFVIDEFHDAAYLDTALPIGGAQTISQPFTVAFMLDLLDVQEGETVLDIGYGSGWQSALLAHLVGPEGKVFAIEIVPELCRFGEENVKKYPELAERVVFYCRSASSGLNVQSGSIDKIIAAADVYRVPSPWRDELRVGGKLVYPSQGAIIEETKLGRTNFARKEYPGFVFVPYVNDSQK